MSETELERKIRSCNAFMVYTTETLHNPSVNIEVMIKSLAIIWSNQK